MVEGPYRYVRNPLYDGDFCLILGAALLTQSWALVLVAVLDLGLLAFQLPFEERELRERFGIHTAATASSCPVSSRGVGPYASKTFIADRVVVL